MTKKTVTSICLSLVWVASLAGGAQVQAKHRVEFTTSVPFEFTAGDRTLPAGTYTFEMATGAPAGGDQAAVLIVRSVDRGAYVALVTDVAQGEHPQPESTAVFSRFDGHTVLSQVWQKGTALGLQLHQSLAAGESARAPRESGTVTLLAVTSARTDR